MNFNLLSNKKLPVLLHVLAWTIILIIPHYLINTYGDGNQQFLFQLYANTAIYGVIFYLNYLWLVPRFFFPKKKARIFSGCCRDGDRFIFCDAVYQ